MTGDEWDLVQRVAASAAQSCELVEAADKLAHAVQEYRVRGTAYNADAMIRALEAFKVLRQRQ